MKKKRYSEEQIIGILKENEEGISVEQLARKHDVATVPSDAYRPMSTPNVNRKGPGLLPLRRVMVPIAVWAMPFTAVLTNGHCLRRSRGASALNRKQSEIFTLQVS